MIEPEQVIFRQPDEYEIGELVLSDEKINARIATLAKDIAKTYLDKNLLIVGIMKGGLRTLTDLTTQLHDEGLTDLEITTITVKSYLGNTTAQQDPKVTQDMDIPPLGRHILIVDDVADTGKSMRQVHEKIAAQGALSVASFVLFDKPSQRQVAYVPTYIGFTVPGKLWLQGRGMDSDEVGRADRNVRRGPYFYGKRAA